MGENLSSPWYVWCETISTSDNTALDLVETLGGHFPFPWVLFWSQVYRWSPNFAPSFRIRLLDTGVEWTLAFKCLCRPVLSGTTSYIIKCLNICLNLCLNPMFDTRLNLNSAINILLLAFKAHSVVWVTRFWISNGFSDLCLCSEAWTPHYRLFKSDFVRVQSLY